MKPILTLVLSAVLALASLPSGAAAQSAPPPADPADVATLDAIIAALYDVISGPAGQPRDWDRMRSLFLPEGRLIPTGPAQGGGHRARFLTVEDYISTSGPFIEENGFREEEIARRTEQWGNIAHVFSTYAGTLETQPDRPAMRGINSIQLMNDGERWWVVNVFWEGERADNPLPEKYLK